jgi:hypothetical protein
MYLYLLTEHHKIITNQNQLKSNSSDFRNSSLQNAILSNKYSLLRSKLESKSKNRRYHIASNKLVSNLLKKSYITNLPELKILSFHFHF